MKSMDEYISEVYKKYKETEDSNQKYKAVKMKAYDPLNKIYGVTACLALIVAFCVGVNYIQIDKNEDEIKYASTEVIEKEENGERVFTQIINSDYKFMEQLKRMVTRAELIVIASDFDVKKYDFEIRLGNFFLKPFGELEINKILKGNSEINRSTIEISKYLGKVSLKELEKNNSIDWLEWEKNNIGYVIPEDEKANTYFQQLSSKGCEFEMGKQYLVCMNYNEEKKIYEIADIDCGIVEYDPNTNMIKNIETGEFEEFDWSLIK